MSEKNLGMKLPSLDDLFTTQKERDEKDLEKIQKIPIDKISDFPNHPFKIVKNEEMEKLAESIKENGFTHPTIVRPKEDGTYEMISGHRRKFAAGLAGLTEVDAIVRNMTDDEATILMVDSNIQREEILPSERAFAYKMKLEALVHQGKKNDLTDNLTSNQVGGKLESAGIIGKENGDSQTQVRRYIRLTYLIPELLDKVDEKIIGISQGEHLSYLNDEFQYLVLNKIEYDEVVPNVAQSIKLKKIFQEGNLTEEKLEQILDEVKPNQLENQNIKYREIRKYFPKGYTNDKIRDVIHKFLENYYDKWHSKELSSEDVTQKRNDAR